MKLKNKEKTKTIVMKETIKNNLGIKIIIDINLKILKEKINHKISNHLIQLTIKLISFIKTEKETITKRMIIKIIVKE